MNAAVVEFNPLLRRAQHAFDMAQQPHTTWTHTDRIATVCLGIARTTLRLSCLPGLAHQRQRIQTMVRYAASGSVLWELADVDNSMDFVRLPDTVEPTSDLAPQVAGNLIIDPACASQKALIAKEYVN